MSFEEEPHADDYDTLSEEHRKYFGDRLQYPSGSGCPHSCIREYEYGTRENNMKLVLEKTNANLNSKVAGTWGGSDDLVFAEFFEFVNHSVNHNLPMDPVHAWQQLQPCVTDASAAMAAKGVRLHLGSPYYNLGLSHFAMGDFDTAYGWVTEAGMQDELDGRGSRHSILIGKHCLSDQIIIDPLENWLQAHDPCCKAFEAACGEVISGDKLIEMLEAMLSRPENAMQCAGEFHRLVKAHDPPGNSASIHTRVRALADLTHLVESTLRVWQLACEGKHLYDRLGNMLGPRSNSQTAFREAHDRFCAQFPKDPMTKEPNPDKESAIGINWAIQDGLRAFDASSQLAERVGISAYLVVRLRNSLLHINDGTVSLYSNGIQFDRVLGITLGVIRLVQLAHSGNLPA